MEGVTHYPPVGRRSGQVYIDIAGSDSGSSLAPDPTPTRQVSSGTNVVYSQYLADVMEIVPDVLPEYALELVKSYHESHHDNILESVLQALSEHSYPKAETGKARKWLRMINHRNKDCFKADVPNYRNLALEQLYLDFPFISMVRVRHIFSLHNGRYTPTYLALSAEQQSGKPSPRIKVKAKFFETLRKGKFKEKHDDLLQEERAWILVSLRKGTVANDAIVVEQLDEEEYEDSRDGIECGCCFTTYSFDKMVQCPDGHLFCVECMTSYSENLLGSHDPNIICMDQSGCRLPFSYSELRRVLTPKLLDLYDRVKQTKDIAMAGLENLEECPHCEFKVVIDNPEERLFRCQNKNCKAVTCRECKKPDHLPKRCREVAQEDKKLVERHFIEEAMTRALTRNCPKCHKAIVKEFGCNKMRCPCGTFFCYTCRQIVNGYGHFERQNNNQLGSVACVLSDPGVDQRHADEVAAAAKRAMEEFRHDHPDVDQQPEDVQVDRRMVPAAERPNQLFQYVQTQSHVQHRSRRVAEWVAMHRVRTPSSSPGPGLPSPAPPPYTLSLDPDEAAAEPDVHPTTDLAPVERVKSVRPLPVRPLPRPPLQRA